MDATSKKMRPRTFRELPLSSLNFGAPWNKSQPSPAWAVLMAVAVKSFHNLTSFGVCAEDPTTSVTNISMAAT